MNAFVLAARNLRRNGRRSLITLLALVIGTMAILLLGGYARDITFGLQTIYVQHTGHLQLVKAGYNDFGRGNPAAYGISRSDDILQLLRDDPVLAPMLTVATPMLQFGGIGANAGHATSIPVAVQGVVAKDLGRLLEWNSYDVPIPASPHGLDNTAPDAALIGMGVARILQMCDALGVAGCPEPPPVERDDSAADTPDELAALSAGDAAQDTTHDAAMAPGASASASSAAQLDVLTASTGSAPNIARLGVARAVKQGMQAADDSFVGMHLAQAQKLVFGQGDPKVTTLVMQFQHTAQIDAARERLEQLLAGPLRDAGLEIRDVFELNPPYRQTIDMVVALFVFVATLMAVIVLFTVSNTMSMAIMERTVEIGTLRAIGIQRPGVLRMFVAEGGLLGMTGWVLGAILALGIALLLERSGIPWSPPGMAIEIPVTARFWNAPELVVFSSVGIVVLSMASAWLPSRRASRMNVVDALRHV